MYHTTEVVIADLGSALIQIMKPEWLENQEWIKSHSFLHKDGVMEEQMLAVNDW